MTAKAGKRLLTVTALTLLMAFVLSAMSAQASKVWKSFEIINKTERTVDAIIAGGISSTKCPQCASGAALKFPSCYKESIYIGAWGIEWLNGYYYGEKSTSPGQKRRIGARCRRCAGPAGAGVWLESRVPRAWFPTSGIKCGSPVYLVIDDSLPRPVTVANIEYAVLPDPVGFDSLMYDWDWGYVGADLPPESLLYPGDSIEIVGLWPEYIADSTALIRAQLIALVDAEGRGTFWDTVYFTAQIMPCCNGDGIRGNVDDETGPAGEIDVADLTYLVGYLFQAGEDPACGDEANVDAIVGPGGPIDVADLTYLVAYLFQSGPAPAACP